MTKRWKCWCGMLVVSMVWAKPGWSAETTQVYPLGPAAQASMATTDAQACQSAHRRKILVAGFPVQSPVQLADLPKFPQMLQIELARRLEQQGSLLALHSSQEATYALPPGQYAMQWEPEWIRDLARRHGVQFVLGGSVHDAGFEGERYTLSAGTDMRAGERKQEFDIPLLRFFKPGIKATPAARRFEFELQLFDGSSGSRISQHVFSGKVQGEVVMPQSIEMNSQRFFDSDFGKLVSAKLDESTQRIVADVQCEPLQMRVVRVESSRLMLDAGSTSGLRVGDALQLRHRQAGTAPLLSLDRNTLLGWPAEIAGTLRLTQVQAHFSIAEKEGTFSAEVGDHAVTPTVPVVR